MGTIIAKQNYKILANAANPTEVPTQSCNCNNKENCPLEGHCLKKNVVYQTTLTQEDGKVENYVGLTAQTFKKRWDGHTNSFRNEDYSTETALSIHIWNLKRENIGYNLKWKVISRASPFSSISGRCNMCTEEKLFIIYHPQLASLNQKNELFIHCRHKTSMLLDKT